MMKKTKENYKPHMMYGDGKSKKANTYEEHMSLKKKGWGHSKPKMKKGGKPKGLWHNIHAKRKRGEAPAKPGDKDYPKTLNVEKGGKMNGPSHDNGGIDINVEGGEIVVNKTINDAAGKHEAKLLALNKNPDNYEIVKKDNYPVFDARKRGK